MEMKKYVSLDRLTTYNDLINEKIVKSNNSVLSSATSYSDANLDTAKTYTDNALSQKSQVLIITWEDDD